MSEIRGGGGGNGTSPKIVRGLRGDRGFGESFDFFRFDVDDAMLILQFPGDAERGFLRDHETAGLEERWNDNHVGDARFVFEADEDKTFCGARTLTADDRARDGD